MALSLVGILVCGPATVLRAGAPAGRQGAAQVPPPLSMEEEQAFLRLWAAEPRLDVGVPAGTAKVVVVKFSDWQCPGCKWTHQVYEPILDQIEKSKPGSIKSVIKDFPLNVKCNANWSAQSVQHPGTCEAAVAARAAADHGKSAEMAQWLWDHQESSGDQVKLAAKVIGGVLDFDQQFALKIGDVRRDVTDGGVLRVDSTPTYFVNGVRVRGFFGGAWDSQHLLDPRLFEDAIRFEMNRIKH
jgi:hypothetical protein